MESLRNRSRRILSRRSGCPMLPAECGRQASRRSPTACIASGPDPAGSTRGWRSTGTCFSGGPAGSGAYGAFSAGTGSRRAARDGVDGPSCLNVGRREEPTGCQPGTSTAAANGARGARRTRRRPRRSQQPRSHPVVRPIRDGFRDPLRHAVTYPSHALPERRCVARAGAGPGARLGHSGDASPDWALPGLCRGLRGRPDVDSPASAAYHDRVSTGPPYHRVRTGPW